MSKRYFEGQFLQDIANEEYDDSVIEVIETSEWEQDYKMQFRDITFKFEGKVYCFSESRSGSPFTDWHYDDIENQNLEELVQVEVIVRKWVPLSQKIKSQLR